LFRAPGHPPRFGGVGGPFPDGRAGKLASGHGPDEARIDAKELRAGINRQMVNPREEKRLEKVKVRGGEEEEGEGKIWR